MTLINALGRSPVIRASDDRCLPVIGAKRIKMINAESCAAALWPLYIVVFRPGFIGQLSTCIAIAFPMLDRQQWTAQRLHRSL